MPDGTEQSNTNQTQTTGTAQTGGAQQPPPTFDVWLSGQDDGVRGLIDGHVKGLRTALESERGERKGLEKQVRDLARGQEKDSDAQRKLTEIADQLSETDRRAGFYELAHQAGVTNLKLAYLVAVQDEIFDRHGNANIERLKQSYPELFTAAQKTPQGNAGAGTNNPPAAQGMNEYIRRAAGR